MKCGPQERMPLKDKRGPHETQALYQLNSRDRNTKCLETSPLRRGAVSHPSF